MGIFDLKSVRNNTKSTKGFYFGAPEAEAENVNGYKLINYFEDYLDILSNLQLGKFIFIGRKGVGKSAIAKFIKDKSDNSDQSFATILRISDFEIEKNIQIEGDSFKMDMLLFEWLILVNIVKLVVNNDCGTYTSEFEKLRKFLDNNSGVVAVDKFQIDEGFKKSGGEISFGVLTHSFGGVFKKYFDVKVTKAPFYKIIPPLKEIVKIILDYSINKDTEFWLLFDDLDINFSISNVEDKLKVMELIRLAKSYNNEVFTNNHAKILVFLRDDIRNVLISEYPDSAKIFNSYEITINWYNHMYSMIDEKLIPIKQLINRRIELNFKNNNIEFTGDAWNSLFCNENFCLTPYQKKSSFKYILDFTFYRPRDLITFLSIASEEGFEYPINSINVKNILEKYIAKNIYEIKSELSLIFSEKEKEKLFNTLFPYIIEYPTKSFNQVLEKINALGFNSDSNMVMNSLISYSFLIPQSLQGELYFNYRENGLLDKNSKEDLNITLPKCIYHYYRKIY